MITASLEPQSVLLKIARLPKELEKEAFTGVKVAALFMGDEIAKSITTGKYGVKTDTGRLRSSFAQGDQNNIFSLTNFSGGVLGTIGSNVKYAAIQERGGTIVPKNAGALAIPINDEARHRKPRSFNLKMIKRQGRPPLLVRDVGGKFKRSDIMYVLKKSVRIPPHYYMRNTMLARRVAAARIFWDTVKKSIGVTK